MVGARKWSIGQQLKHYRLAAGLTQQTLAERAGLSVRSVSNLERDRCVVPRSSTLDRLCEALDLGAVERAMLRAEAQPLSAPAYHRASDSQRLAPLIGREAMQAELGRHLAGEGPPLLLLAGEAGIGKTRLLQELCCEAAERGFTVLASGAPHYGMPGPYAPLLDALSRFLAGQPPAVRRRALQGCASVEQLLLRAADMPSPPAIAEHDLHSRPWQLPAAIARFLTNVAGPTGTLLILDDLQRASADALALLGALVHASAPDALHWGSRPDWRLRLRIAAAYRDTDVAEDGALCMLLADLATSQLVGRHTVGPLAPHHAARLLDHLLARVTEVVVPATKDRMLQRADGVPFFLVSLALDARHSVAPGAMLPWDLQQAIHQQTARLSPLARDVVAVVAVHGRYTTRDELGAVICRPEQDVDAALAEACRARLLVEGRDLSYGLAHDVVGEVIAVRQGGAARATLHRRLSIARERRDATPALP